jgi:hypothetical protein
MCTGFEIAALAAAAGGTALSVTGAQQAAREKQRTLIQGIDEQSSIQKKANDRTDEFVTDTYTPDARMQNYEMEAATGEKTLGNLLSAQAATGQGDITGATTGAVSDAYTRQKAKTTAATTQSSRNLAKLMARSGAAGGLARNEATAGSDYSSDLLGYGAESKMAQNGTNVALGQAGSGGGGLALLGGLLSGSAGMIGGMGKPAPLPLQVGM